MALRRIVIVGLGSIGRRHARLLTERGDLSVELFDPSPDALKLIRQEIGNLPSHDSFEDMLSTKPEMVLIATPHSMHALQAIESLESGIHVMCEKPMSNNIKSALEMSLAAENSGKVLNIGFSLHFNLGIKKLKKIIEDGVLGSVVHAHARVGTYQTLVNSISHYQANQEGALVFDYAHQMDIFYWMFGKKPIAVYASALQAGSLEFSSNPNMAVINCEYDCSMISSIHLNYIQAPERHEYEIVGDKGWALLDISSERLTIGSRESLTSTSEKIDMNRDDMFRAELQAFIDAVDGKRVPETSGRDGLISTAICEAVIESWQKHKRVELWDGFCED